MKTKILIGNLSDVGRVRTANEDYFEAHKGDFGELIIVCDGMGGHKGGALASRLAVDVIKKHFSSLKKGYDPKAELIRAFTEADRQLREKSKDDPELKEMGSTAVTLLITGGVAYTAHVGDSRIYMIRNGQIHQLTKDHSLVQQLMDAGILNSEQAKNHPNKNVITKTLGADKPYQPDVSESIVLFKGDKYVLCSDGLTGYLEENEIRDIAAALPPQEACIKLVNSANERGGKDNITVQIVEVTKGKHKPLSQKFRNTLLYSGAGILFLTILALFWVFILSSPGGKPADAAGKTKKSDKGKSGLVRKDDSLENKQPDTSKAPEVIKTASDTQAKPKIAPENKKAVPESKPKIKSAR